MQHWQRRYEFQSPSGVLGVCREAKQQYLQALITFKFQSPSGVLGVCRQGGNPPTTDEFLQREVSVPFLGFRGLQVDSKDPFCRKQPAVSVPFRGFRGLQDPL